MITKEIPLSEEEVLELMLSQEEMECFPKLDFDDVIEGNYAPEDGYDHSTLYNELFRQIFGTMFLTLDEWHWEFAGCDESRNLLIRVTGKVKQDEGFLARHGYEEM